MLRKSTTIRKVTRGHAPEKSTGEVRPDLTLVDRLQQWKHVTKSLLHYYQGMSDIEKATTKATLALQDTIQVPFHEGHQFLGEGGWQDVLYKVKDLTGVLGEHHGALQSTLDHTIVKQLEGVHADIKAHIVAIEKEAGALADEVDKLRTASASSLEQLQAGIDTFENSKEQMLPQKDPYISHSLVNAQLKKQVLKENDLQASLIRFQQQQPSFEAGIVTSIQSACTLWEEAKELKSRDIALVEKEISAALLSVAPDAEYNFYANREGAVIDPNTPYRSVDAVDFPGLNHPSSIAIKEGPLERKKRFTKSYKESTYVLSPSGYLHERKVTDDNTVVPTFSLFLPECSLGPPAKANAKSHKFFIEGNKAAKSSVESGVKNAFKFGGKEISYTFRARTDADMRAWWTVLDTVSRDTKTEVPANAVAGPTVISAAVTNVGRTPPPASPVSATSATVGGDAGVGVGAGAGTAAGAGAAAGGLLVPRPAVIRGASHSDVVHLDAEEEEAGSSDEEMYETAPVTAPSTPGVQGILSSPLENAGVAQESLPGYAGQGVTKAEKEALREKGIGGSAHAPSASTSA